MQNNATIADIHTQTNDPSTSPISPSDRDALVRQSLPLVRAIAERLRRRYSLSANFDDLCAMGLTGLAIAVDRFEPVRGASFVTFAHHKIRGAILDGLRRSDRRYSFEKRCRKAAERRAARRGTAADNAGWTEAGTTVQGDMDEVASSLCQVVTMHLASISGADEDNPPLQPDELLLRRETRERVKNAITWLPKMEREIVALCYYGDGSFSDAAATLGISRAWASRLHKRALAALRASLAEQEDDATTMRVSPNAVPVKEAGRVDAADVRCVTEQLLHRARCSGRPTPRPFAHVASGRGSRFLATVNGGGDIPVPIPTSDHES